METYQYNMSENSKKTLTIDMSKVDSPITLDFINDTGGQVWITRNGNTATITGYAMKTVNKATVHLYAKADIYTYPTYQYNHLYNQSEDTYYWERIQTSDATHQIQWGHYEYIDNDGYFGGWDFWSPDVSITSMQETEATIANDECQKSTITYYTGDIYGKNLREIGEKVFNWEEVPEEGTLRDYRNPIISIVDAVDYFPGNLTNYQGGGSVVDYTRKYVKITVKNIDKYNGNGIIVNTENGKYNNYNLFDTYEVEGTGNNNNKFKGSNFNESFKGTTSADKIYTGGGTDSIDAGKGNDKIYISGKGNKTININKGDGNDIIYTAQKADKVTLNFDTTKLYYTKSGNDLIITRAYDESEEGTAIAGFFKKKPNVYINDAEKDLFYNIEKDNISLTQTGNSKKITGSKYSDQIFAGVNTTTVNAKGGDNLIVTNENNKKAMSLSAGNGDDIYYLQNLDKKITISDGGGEDDFIIISDPNYSKDNLFLFYDIKLGKNNTTTVETSLHILSTENNTGNAIKSRKGKLSENIVVKNFQTKDDYAGKGGIEGVYFEDDSFFNPDWDSLKGEVAGWLSDNGYKSSMSAFKSASAEDISELIQIYVKYSDVPQA